MPEGTREERALDDLNTGGAFAPPSSGEAALNPPTESQSNPNAVVERTAPPQRHDPARPEMPLTPITEPEKPAASGAERLEKDKVLLQPADTKENEFQSGEHVAYNQPTESAPIVTQTTGEGMGAGVEPMAPEQKEVMDTTAAPHQPTGTAMDPTRPDVADAVMSGTHSPEMAEGLAPSDTISPTPVTRAGRDDLTIIGGVGPKMQEALRAAGIDSYTKLSMATDEEIRAAITQGGVRLTRSLSTWREQAGFLARGDRAGFDALKNAKRGETDSAHEDEGDQKRTNFIDPGRS